MEAIRFIKAEESLPLRSKYLRDGMDPERCLFEGDDLDSSVHIGCFVEEHLVSVVSFYNRPRPISRV